MCHLKAEYEFSLTSNYPSPQIMACNFEVPVTGEESECYILSPTSCLTDENTNTCFLTWVWQAFYKGSCRSKRLQDCAEPFDDISVEQQDKNERGPLEYATVPSWRSAQLGASRVCGPTEWSGGAVALPLITSTSTCLYLYKHMHADTLTSRSLKVMWNQQQ